MFSLSKTPVKEGRIYAQVTRADGTIEGNKLVAYWSRNPFKRWFMKLKHKELGKIKWE